MTATARVLLVGEDQKFLDFLEAAVPRIGAESDVPVDVVDAQVTRGCRLRDLARRVGRADATRIDLICVGADASRKGRPVTHKRKATSMREHLSAGVPVVIAAATPSIEAWLLADPKGLVRGLASGTGVAGAVLEPWPTPKREREAKAALGRVVQHAVGGKLDRMGFEYVPEIMKEIRLRDSPDDSLRSLVEELAGALERLGGGE